MGLNTTGSWLFLLASSSCFLWLKVGSTGCSGAVPMLRCSANGH